MGILGAMGILGTPGTAGLLMEGERGQSRGNGSPPSHVERVITYFAHVTHPTHVRVLLDRTDRLPDILGMLTVLHSVRLFQFKDFFR